MGKTLALAGAGLLLLAVGLGFLGFGGEAPEYFSVADLLSALGWLLAVAGLVSAAGGGDSKEPPRGA